VVGLILGPLAETQFRRAMQMNIGDAWVFVESPVSATLLALALIALVAPLVMKGLSRLKSAED
jgi:putative tricarboxylic transport membrane protein